MSSRIIEPPFSVYHDKDGLALESGNIYIGVTELNPVDNPVPVYYDIELTQPAQQPIRTVGGYPSREGSPAQLYTDCAFSMVVQDKNGVLVYSSLSSPCPLNATDVPWVSAEEYGDGSHTSATLSEALTEIGSDEVTLYLMNGNWSITSNIIFPKNVTVRFSSGTFMTIGGGLTVDFRGLFGKDDLGVSFKSTGDVIFSAEQPQVHPEWFGCILNDETGTIPTDNALFMQKVTSSITANGGKVFFSPGTLTVEPVTPITVGANVVFEGKDSTSILKVGANSSNTFEQTSLSGFTTRNMAYHLDSTLNPAVNDTTVILRLIDSTDVIIENVEFESFQTPLMLSGATNYKVDNCHFVANPVGGYCGFSAVESTITPGQLCEEGRITNNIFEVNGSGQTDVTVYPRLADTFCIHLETSNTFTNDNFIKGYVLGGIMYKKLGGNNNWAFKNSIISNTTIPTSTIPAVFDNNQKFAVLCTGVGPYYIDDNVITCTSPSTVFPDSNSGITFMHVESESSDNDTLFEGTMIRRNVISSSDASVFMGGLNTAFEISMGSFNIEDNIFKDTQNDFIMYLWCQLFEGGVEKTYIISGNKAINESGVTSYSRFNLYGVQKVPNNVLLWNAYIENNSECNFYLSDSGQVSFGDFVHASWTIRGNTGVRSGALLNASSGLSNRVYLPDATRLYLFEPSGIDNNEAPVAQNVLALEPGSEYMIGDMGVMLTESKGAYSGGTMGISILNDTGGVGGTIYSPSISAGAENQFYTTRTSGSGNPFFNNIVGFEGSTDGNAGGATVLNLYVEYIKVKDAG